MKPLTSGVCFATHKEQEAISLKCVLQGAVVKPSLASFQNPAPSESRKIFPFDYQKITERGVGLVMPNMDQVISFCVLVGRIQHSPWRNIQPVLWVKPDFLQHSEDAGEVETKAENK